MTDDEKRAFIARAHQRNQAALDRLGEGPPAGKDSSDRSDDVSDPDFVPVFGPTRCAHLNEAGELVWTEGQMYVHQTVADGFFAHMEHLYPEVGLVSPDDGQPYETPDGWM